MVISRMGLRHMRSLRQRRGRAMSCAARHRLTGMEATNLAGLYDLPLIDWAAIEARLQEGLGQAPGSGGPERHTCWLATINPDGSPHVTGVGALWADAAWWFETGKRTRKGRNLARDARCTLSVATRDFDLIVEGAATVVTDPATVSGMAARWAAAGWPARPDDTGTALTAEFSAPSAGPPPWHVYRIAVRTATVLSSAGPGGATRWRF
jgi:PPOX class probable F420-dependent enzyme